MSLARSVAIAVAALVVGVASFAFAITGRDVGGRVVWAVFGPLVGWSFVATGLYAWRRRPGSRFGALMVLLGFAWFFAPLSLAGNSVAFTLALVLGGMWGAVLAHVLLSFPSGRLDTRRERALVLAAYVLVPLVQAPEFLFASTEDITGCSGACPGNLLLVAREPGLAATLFAAGAAVTLTLIVLLLWMLVAKWRSAGRSERRSFAPILIAGASSFGFVVAYLATQAQPLLTFAFLSLAATPFAFLAGLARADVAQSRGMRTLMGRLAELPGRGDLRDALADALGDPGLSLAFWIPEQQRYVDAAGAAVELPGADDATRAVTPVERDGRPVAAIVHDRALTGDAQSVRAAGAATALMLDNERLDAELRAKIVELRASRQRLVAAADTERRRLERDLHDGAQSRLVALALSMRRARPGFVDGSPAAVLVDGSIDEVRRSLDELRELARGIHPAVLSDRGLEPAVRALAARAPVPVELVGAPGGRLPAAVETAAYFVVSEALANVAKYAHAGHATVRMERHDGRLVLEVADDGVGGASPAGGSGLNGLADRVAALDGVLQVVSPPGHGTRLLVDLPCV